MPKSPQSFSTTAFSLIEILVACAVLALLVTLLAGSLSGVTNLTRASGARLMANNQAVTVFDRIAQDLSARVHNSEMYPDFNKDGQVTGGLASNNDSFSLLVNARTTAENSRFARVGYEVGHATTGATTDSLIRCLEPFLWTDGILNTTLSASAEKQSLGRGVVRFELCFLNSQGQLVAAAPAADEVSAVICSVASLDEGTLAQLTSGQIDQICQALPNAENDKLPIATWSTVNFSGLPPSVGQSIRYHQRYFYLK